MYVPPREELYLNTSEGIAVVYDVRLPGVAERFHHDRLAWGEAADVEMLDLDHPVLIVRPGGARRCK